MKTYFQCSHCNQFEEVGEENSNVYFTSDDINQENPLCKGCFYDHQDKLAYDKSDGEFTNYEDWMESLGATICYSEDTLGREL